MAWSACTHSFSGQLCQGLTPSKRGIPSPSSPDLLFSQVKTLSCHHQAMESISIHTLEMLAVLLTHRPFLDSLLRRPSTGALQKA